MTTQPESLFDLKDGNLQGRTSPVQQNPDGSRTPKHVQPGTLYSDVSVATLSAAQAAGDAPCLGGAPTRKFFAIVPEKDGRLYVANADGTKSRFSYPLFGGLPRTFSGQECPTNGFYVTGQTTGALLAMAEG